jgi:hypothetical protein
VANWDTPREVNHRFSFGRLGGPGWHDKPAAQPGSGNGCFEECSAVARHTDFRLTETGRSGETRAALAFGAPRDYYDSIVPSEQDSVRGSSMSRVVKAIAIISLGVGITGVVGACIEFHRVLAFLRGDLPETLRPLEATEGTIDLIQGALVQDLERQIAEATDGRRKAELRGKLAKMKEEAQARERDRGAFDRGIRRDLILFTIAECIWVAVSALLAVSALCVLRATGPGGRRLLAISLALPPLTFPISWLLTGLLLGLPWGQLLGALFELLGLRHVYAAGAVAAIVGARIAVAYPPVALLLLWRAKAKEGAA